MATKPKLHHYHQAGHAVAALHFGKRILQLTTNTEQIEALTFEWTSPEALDQSTSQGTESETRVLIALSGLAAERISQGITSGCFPRERLITELDRHHAGNFFDFSMNLVVWERKAVELLRGKWPEVQALAELLLENESATDAQAAEIIGRTNARICTME